MRECLGRARTEPFSLMSFQVIEDETTGSDADGVCFQDWGSDQTAPKAEAATVPGASTCLAVDFDVHVPKRSMPRGPFQFLLFRSEGERLGFRDLSNNIG